METARLPSHDVSGHTEGTTGKIHENKIDSEEVKLVDLVDCCKNSLIFFFFFTDMSRQTTGDDVLVVEIESRK